MCGAGMNKGRRVHIVMGKGEERDRVEEKNCCFEIT